MSYEKKLGHAYLGRPWPPFSMFHFLVTGESQASLVSIGMGSHRKLGRLYLCCHVNCARPRLPFHLSTVMKLLLDLAIHAVEGSQYIIYY